MARIIALDYGKERTGIAITDELQLIASGLTTVKTKDLLPYLKEYVANEKVSCMVVGEPKQLNNIPSESEVLIQVFLDKLKASFPSIHIERQDERFTSKVAFQTMIETGVKKKRRQKKELIDEISATLILQSYLNRIK
ncbi:Holliday junction resolvase RuvX [uncultured Eudoraea sp.]|uniref:Holliday junction resolvase RuvX n=1 Tax=uncultured Eudoraea sp. TaxID=1035614 RepID=UPI002633EC51|nr:Holliday junction resolvase RuvX [uncultured Eudoraea sp.]